MGARTRCLRPGAALNLRGRAPWTTERRLLLRRGHLSRCSCLWTHRRFVVAQRSARGGVHGTSPGLTDWRPLVARACPTGAARIYNAVSEPRAQQVPSGGGGRSCLGAQVQLLSRTSWLDGSKMGPDLKPWAEKCAARAAFLSGP